MLDMHKFRVRLRLAVRIDALIRDSASPARPSCRILFISLALLAASPEALAQNPMPQIIENVRANEALYQNIEVVLRKTYCPGQLTSPNSPCVSSLEETSRFVYQGGRIFFRNDEVQKGPNDPSRGTVASQRFDWGWPRPGPRQRDTLQAYDGQCTRVIEGRRLAKLYDGRWEDPRLLRPHTMLLTHAYVHFPLSVFLGGQEAIASHALGGPYATFFTLTLRFDKEELIDGRRCLKICAEAWADPAFPKESSVRFLWLAPEANYLPLRVETYRPSTGMDSPSEIGHVEELRELAPGVWFPFRASIVVYDEEWRNGSKAMVADAEEYTVEKALLDPGYEISLFRNIIFPSEVLVQRFKTGKSLGCYWHGEHDDTVEPGFRLWLLAGALVMVAGAAIVGFLYYRPGESAWRWPPYRSRR